MKTSILITAYRRPEFLRECATAALMQTLAPFEVIISDDSPEDMNEPIVEELKKLAAQKNIALHYFHNKPSLGQAPNIQSMLEKSRGDLVCLIHDDDLLLTNALADLVPAFEDPQIIAAFGQQKILSHEGVEDVAASENLNKNFRRTKEFEGIQSDAFESALTQQFPNNGWIVRRDAALQAGYAHLHKTFGDACDFGFGLFLAFTSNKEGVTGAQPLKFFFKNKYTACYRLSNDSLWRNNPRSNFAYYAFRFVNADARIDRAKPYVEKWLHARSGPAIAEATNLGHTKEAWAWILGPWHRWQLLTPGGIKRLFKLLFSKNKN